MENKVDGIYIFKRFSKRFKRNILTHNSDVFTAKIINLKSE